MHRLRTASLVVAFLIAGGGAAAVGGALRAQGLPAAANLAQLISLLGLLPLLAAVVGWWRRGRRPGVVTPADLAAARELLALLVAGQWRAEAAARELDHPDPIPVRWRITEQPGLIDVPGNLTAGVLTVASSADITTLIAEFRALRRRRLVLLGGAGSGKTTLAVQILLGLLDERADRPADPVPVLFSLADWRPGTDDLRRWLVARIMADHPALADAGHGRATIEKLVDDGQVMPVLDGLDEAPAEVRTLFVTAVNRSLAGRTQLVLTSRTDEYRDAVGEGTHVLSSAVVIQPEPLTAPAAAEYLERCLPPAPRPVWREVLLRLRGPGRDGAALAEVVATPLGLWLVRATYITPDADPAPLLAFATAGALRAHLFDELVGATIRSRPPSDDPAQIFRPRRAYDPGQALSALRFLARNMTGWERRDFDWTADLARLTVPPVWPADAAGLLRRVMPAVERALARLGDISPRRRLGLGALLLLTLFLSATTGAFGALVALGFVLAGLTLVILLALGWEHTEDGRPDWEAALRDGVEGARVGLLRVATVAVFALGSGLFTGVLTGAVGHLVLRDPRAWWAGLAVTVLVVPPAVVVQRPANQWRTPAPWYGNTPIAGLVVGLFFGMVLGGATAVVLSIMYGGATDLFVVVAVVSCLALGASWAVAVPLLCSLSALAARPFRRTRPARDGEPLALWRSEQAGQRARLIRLAVISVLLTAAVSAGGAAVPDPPAGTIGFTVAGHWRYLIALVAGAVAVRAGPSRRRWAAWLGGALVAVLVIRLWPDTLRADDARLRVDGRFAGGSATFEVDSTAGHAARTVDLDAVLRDGGVRVVLLIWLTVLAWSVVATLYFRVESGHSRDWWPARLAIWWHVRRGRLPADPVLFLDDCRRLGLLRTVGPIYQFRHAEFQDHLARAVDSPAIRPGDAS